MLETLKCIKMQISSVIDERKSKNFVKIMKQCVRHVRYYISKKSWKDQIQIKGEYMNHAV